MESEDEAFKVYVASQHGYRNTKEYGDVRTFNAQSALKHDYDEEEVKA